MKRKTWLSLLLAVALAGGALLGFSRLFSLRFEAGDIYPAYSSLRSDPLGCKVLHDSLREVPGLTVQRNFETSPKLRAPAACTVYYPGMATWEWSIEEIKKMEAQASDGARVVVTFLP